MYLVKHFHSKNVGEKQTRVFSTANSLTSTNNVFFVISNVVWNRMRKTPFNRWVASGSEEDKSELTGQPESLQLQRVHMSVGVLEKKRKCGILEENTLDFKC